MNFDLDENDHRILKSIFEYSDFDGDGLISKNDLKISSGIQDENDVESIFGTLKESAGEAEYEEFITYDEFCKGIMDFPFIIDKFKQEYQNNLRVPDIPEENLSQALDGDDPNELGFLPGQLKAAIILYNKALKVELSDFNTVNREDLLEDLRLVLEKLRNKCRQENNPAEVINGSIELYLLVRDLSRYHEEVVSDLKADLSDREYVIKSLNSKIEKLLVDKENILEQLSTLEEKNNKKTNAHIEVLEEKKALQQRLVDAQDQEVNYHEYLSQIENTILSKEKKISHLTKQLRQLTSFKTLQEMRSTIGRTTEDMKNQKKAQLKYRQSVPLTLGSPARSLKPPSNHDIKVQIITEQLKQKKDEVLNKNIEVEVLQDNLRKYSEELLKLKEENHELHERLRLLRFQINNKSSDERDSGIFPSLYEEFMLVRDESSDMSGKKLEKTFENEKNSDTTKEHKQKTKTSVFSMQTSSIYSKPNEKDRLCCVCI